MPRGDQLLRSTLLTASVLLGNAALSQSSVPAADLGDCAAIERDVERLACYDALARRTTADEPPIAPATASESAAAIDAFGSELIESDDIDTPQEIRSRLIGEFAGWRGNTEFRLENGQVWRQAEEGRLVYEADAPLVTIRRGAFNSYRLSVEGVNRTVRVRRIE
jgi:hypothetical protein